MPAWEKIGSGLRPKIGKKNTEKMDFGLTAKIGEKWPRNRKNGLKAHLGASNNEITLDDDNDRRGEPKNPERE